MHLVIEKQTGRIFYALGQTDLQQTRPVYAFVPDDFFEGDQFLKRSYLASRWPSAHCGANPNALGSHVIPNPNKPVLPNSTCPILAEFVMRLKQIASVKIPNKG
ncbi:MAG: hypothetical protein ACK56K_04640 [Akkermansiaceae bacterium]